MGQAYALPIRRSFSEMQDATEGLFTVRRKRRVTVRASISYATLILAPRLKNFRDRHPDIEVSLSTAVWSDRMDNGAIDLDIRYGTGHWDEPEIRKLGEEVATVVCHPDHLRSFGTPARIQDVLSAGIVPVLGSEVEWSRLSDRFGLELPAPPIWVKADSSLIALQTVAAGFGAALIHESFSRPFIDRGVLVSPFDYRLPIREAYYLVARDAVADREEVAAFRNWLMAPETAGGTDHRELRASRLPRRPA